MTATTAVDTLPERLRTLLTQPTATQYNNFSEWKQGFFKLCEHNTSSWERALLGGAQVTCVGYAFAAGYQAALQQLQGETAQGVTRLSALCVTEANGNHPRAIATTLTPATRNNEYLLNGSKTFISGGDQADELLVAASTGLDGAGRPILQLVRVPSGAAGVTITPMPPLPFVPEASHASVRFDKVFVTEQALLTGDGYSDYVKPFRTLEDIHVTLALCGYLISVARRIQLPQAQIPALLSMAAQHVQLALLPPQQSVTHLLLDAARQQLEQCLPLLEAHWAQHAHASFANWQRDKALLKIASKAREQRTATALQQLLGTP